MSDLKKAIHYFYLDYVNNYLTVSRIAEHYGLDPEEASRLIDMGRIINRESNPPA